MYGMGNQSHVIEEIVFEKEEENFLSHIKLRKIHFSPLLCEGFREFQDKSKPVSLEIALSLFFQDKMFIVIKRSVCCF